METGSVLEPVKAPPNPRLQIVYRRIDELKPNPRNPRHHSRKQIKQLACSIQAFGFKVLPSSIMKAM